MVDQYPHSAEIVTQETDATVDADGNWIPGTTQTISLKCRAESATANGYLVGVDGAKIDFSWIVYFPSGIPRIKEGVRITVVNPDAPFGPETMLTDTVKRFSRGQLNVRIWA